jgi:type IV secretion system protein VirD4
VNTLRFFLTLTVLLAGYVAALILYQIPYTWLVAAAILAGKLCNKGYRYTAYGSARFANASDLKPMLAGSGMIIGHVCGKPNRVEALTGLFNKRLPAQDAVPAFLETCRGIGYKPPQPLVRLTQAVHTAVFAPSGAGKGVSCILPMLLTHPASIIVVDPKGENALLTAKHRAEVFHHTIVMIDPFKVVTQTPASFNVLASIDPDDPESFDQIRAIAEAIVQKQPNARDPHWHQKAEIFITGIIAVVIHFYPPEHRSLQVVASIMADKELLSKAIKTLQASDVYGGLLARLGNELAISTDKELDGILSTANTKLAFLSSPAVVESTTGTGGFNAAELANTTVYLILPVQYLRSHAGLLRLWVTSLMRSVVARGVANPSPVHVILDEAAALGHLEAIDDMLSIGRGFGLHITAIYQSMGQLMKCWPEGQHQTFLSNTTQVFFSVNDQQTAEYVSNRLGEETIIVHNDSDGDSTSRQANPQGGHSTTYSTNRSRSRQQVGRKLLKPEEVTALHPRMCIAFVPGVPPIRAWLVRYYEKSFMTTRRIGVLRAAVDTACLFILAAMFAVMFTAALYCH